LYVPIIRPPRGLLEGLCATLLTGGLYNTYNVFSDIIC